MKRPRKQTALQRRAHFHNSLRGHAKSIQTHLRVMLETDSVSAEAKQIAATMLQMSEALCLKLEKRIVP